MGYDFDWVSAFSDQAFGGNGCVVVHGATDLNLETRLNIVRETSLSECTFIEPSDIADFRFRIYLASREIPFAGHPTLAGVASLMHRGLLPGRKITVETHAGIVPLEVLEDGQISMTQIAPEFGANVAAQLVADAVSLSANDIIAPPQIVSTGLQFTVAVVRDRDALGRAKLNIPALNLMSDEIGAPNLDIIEPFLVTLEGATSAGDTFSRAVTCTSKPSPGSFYRVCDRRYG
jgi:trans-2,3-dihydro-3-hydroxyanthranilate isomerase